MDAHAHVQTLKSQSGRLPELLWIWYENVLIRTHVRPQAGWGREGSNEIRRTSGCVKNAHRIKGEEFPT